MIFTLLFWKATFERSLGTAGSIFLSLYGVDAASWLHVDKTTTLQITGIAFVLTVIKCIVVATISDGTPSFGNVETYNVPPKKAPVVTPALPVAEAPVPTPATAPLTPPASEVQ